MFKFIKRCKIKKELRELESKIDYVVSKMKTLINDEDSEEFRHWGLLNLCYLKRMVELRSQLES